MNRRQALKNITATAIPFLLTHTSYGALLNNFYSSSTCSLHKPNLPKLNYQVLVDKGLKVASGNIPDYRKFGWATINFCIDEKINLIDKKLLMKPSYLVPLQQLDKSNHLRIEELAFRNIDPESINAISNLYNKIDPLRQTRLCAISDDAYKMPNATRDFKFYSFYNSVLISFNQGYIIKNELLDSEIYAGNAIHLVKLFNNRESDLPSISELDIHAITNSDILLNFLILLSFCGDSKFRTINGLALTKRLGYDFDLLILDYLKSKAQEGYKSFSVTERQILLANTTLINDRISKFQNNFESGSNKISYDSIFNNKNLLFGYDKISDVSVKNNEVIITPTPNTYMQAGGTTTDANQILEPRDAIGASTWSPDQTVRMFGISAKWKILKNNNGVYSDCASGFNHFSGTTEELDTPGLVINCLGLEHKTLHWQNAPALVSTLTYQIKAGFLPHNDTNWVAIRLKKVDSYDINVTVKGTAQNFPPVPIEANTNWSIYSVYPNHMLEFNVEFKPKVVEVNSGWSFQLLDPQQEFIEVVEINSDTIKYFDNLNLLDLRVTSTHNQLLSYVSSTQNSLMDNGWLNPDPTSMDFGANQSLTRLYILNSLVANYDPASNPTGGTDPSNDNFLARINFLRQSIPVLCYRLYQTFIPKLEREMLLISGILAQVSSAKGDLSRVLAILASVDLPSVNVTVNNADRLISGNSLSNPIETLDDIIPFVIGSYNKLSNLEKELAERKFTQCNSISNMQIVNHTVPKVYLERISDPEIINTCK